MARPPANRLPASHHPTTADTSIVLTCDDHVTRKNFQRALSETPRATVITRRAAPEVLAGPRNRRSRSGVREPPVHACVTRTAYNPATLLPAHRLDGVRNASDRASLLDRLQLIRAEYDQHPDLRLTQSQVEELWELDAMVANALLSALVSAGVLTKATEGGYVRARAQTA